MRCAVSLLVLLFCLSGTWAHGYSGEAESMVEENHTTGDIWVELITLRDIVMQQTVELKNIEVELKYNKVEKTDYEHVQLTNNVEINGLSEKQTAGETTTPYILTDLKELRDMVVEQKVELSYLKTEHQALKNEVEEHWKWHEDKPKVAFSVGLTTSIYAEPVDTATTLIYDTVFTNVGQAYNPITGVFTAPVKGVYYFRFTAYQSGRFTIMGVQLQHNGTIVLDNTYAAGRGSHMANGLALELEIKDVVYLQLPPGIGINDDANPSTFSGFLLFPM